VAIERLEVRLDPARRRKLADIAAARSSSISEIVREMIDRSYEEVQRAERRRAVDALAQLQIEDVPDPETLSRQLDAAHDVGDLY
jgi:hypothetical protein